MQKVLLGVNVDHVATIRQARGTTRYPDPVQAAIEAEQAGADNITVHLREDRRHIQERDVALLKEVLQTRMNLEMAAAPEMIAIALKYRPEECCLVPEKRAELTTEGGLDVIKQQAYIKKVCSQLTAQGIQVSLFIAPDLAQIEAAVQCGVPIIEIHTGHFVDAKTLAEQQHELQRIITAVQYGTAANLIINAGHGLHYHNVQNIAAIPGIHTLNIGHSIVARALFVGMQQAVREMRQLIYEAAGS
ncbi:MAG: pyridoxine 5'-phosphate synthase [Gammaproteobacteria bacterium]